MEKARQLISALKAKFCKNDGLLSDDRGEAYIGEAIKILIAVVVGALVLALVYALMKDTVFPTVADKIQELFDYNPE